MAKKYPEEQQQIGTECPHGNGKDYMGTAGATCWHSLISTFLFVLQLRAQNAVLQAAAWPKSVSSCRVNTLLVEDGTPSIHPRTRLSLRDCTLTGSGTALCLFSGSRLVSFSAKMEVVSGNL